AVSLPEVPLLGVLPGTGGLTRAVDKRKVRKDRADIFATRQEGVRGQTAVDWGLVDGIAKASNLIDDARARGQEAAKNSSRPSDAQGVALTPLQRTMSEDSIEYTTVSAKINHDERRADIVITVPDEAPPADA